jgi:hypothetical protein
MKYMLLRVDSSEKRNSIYIDARERHLSMLAVVTPERSSIKIAFVFQVRDNCQGLE